MNSIPSNTDLAILIPAAGASSRMRGSDKLLERVEGQPLLQRQTQLALDTGMQVCVTLPATPSLRHSLLASLARPSLTLISCQDASEGLAASIRAGAQWAQRKKLNSLMVLLADLPEITSIDLQKMIVEYTTAPQSVFRACDINGTPGHPVIFPQRMFKRLNTLTGDRGANALLKQEKVTLIPLTDMHATTDLDTPEAWAAWRHKSP
ncbi:NTP transferase domain-containing protein [Roseovarius sp. EL26]|uniref:nucleotidyltransferase family protein n=1 Tax=Roseovarius sp. EL26 TaxID=2126672 RepID=UPI000EA00F00|nr:nucleotidyltransferase family protein [Roseovarius sp. EL26]